MPRPLKSAWTYEMTEEEKEKFSDSLRHSVQIATRLRDLLRKRRLDLDRVELRDDLYTESLHKLAFLNGRKRELKAIESLFDFLDP